MVTLGYIHIPEKLDCQWEKPHLNSCMVQLVGVLLTEEEGTKGSRHISFIPSVTVQQTETSPKFPLLDHSNIRNACEYSVTLQIKLNANCAPGKREHASTSRF